ncbi:MAG: hypothetical protein KAR17_05355 [Cyclobacteriaceae bacterium]|nr:hypothetical protein [Cyclobacteriaceae bacterium]
MVHPDFYRDLYNDSTDAERKSSNKVIVGFNYCYGTLFTAIKEQLVSN